MAENRVPGGFKGIDSVCLSLFKGLFEDLSPEDLGHLNLHPPHQSCLQYLHFLQPVKGKSDILLNKFSNYDCDHRFVAFFKLAVFSCRWKFSIWPQSILYRAKASSEFSTVLQSMFKLLDLWYFFVEDLEIDCLSLIFILY